MTIEPAASASSIPRRSDDRPENNTNDQIPNADVAIAATGSGAQAHPAAPAVTPEGHREAELRAEGISTFMESVRHTQSLQEAHHGPRDVGELHELSTFTSGNANSHQERDLERAETPSIDFPETMEKARKRRTRKVSKRFSQFLAAVVTGIPPIEDNQSLIDNLRSIVGDNGEEIYRKYAMGYGRRKRYGWFVEAAFNKIATASSTHHNRWFVGDSAVLLQHIISRWTHSGHRKCFQTSFCDKTAVYLLQNIGDPSDRWLDDTLWKSLGMSPRFLDEHLALVYDGSPLRSSGDVDTHQQVCPHTWHIWATSSGQQILPFNFSTTLPPSSSAALMYLSFQRTDTDSCKLRETDMASSCC